MGLPHIVFHHCAPNTVFGYVQFAIFYIPLIVGLLFLATNHCLLSDITTLLFGAGIFVNNVINSKARSFFAVPRPSHELCIPDDFGMPARESQQLLCYVAIDLVFTYRFNNRRISIKRVCELLFLVALSSAVYVNLGYYTPEQVLVGSLLGAAIGFIIVNIVVLFVSPWLPGCTYSWNAFCLKRRWVPHWFQCAHIFHYHPGVACADSACSITSLNGQCSCIVMPQKLTYITAQFFPIAILAHILSKLIFILLHHFV